MSESHSDSSDDGSLEQHRRQQRERSQAWRAKQPRVEASRSKNANAERQRRSRRSTTKVLADRAQNAANMQSSRAERMEAEVLADRATNAARMQSSRAERMEAEVLADRTKNSVSAQRSRAAAAASRESAANQPELLLTSVDSSSDHPTVFDQFERHPDAALLQLALSTGFHEGGIGFDELKKLHFIARLSPEDRPEEWQSAFSQAAATLRQYTASIKAGIPEALRSYLAKRGQTAPAFACASCGMRETQLKACHVRRRLSELSLFKYDDVFDAERRRRIFAIDHRIRPVFSVYGLPSASGDRLSDVTAGSASLLPSSATLHHLHPELVDPPNSGPLPVPDEHSALVCADCDQYVFASLLSV